jgi:asparagine synthase (glutamine-hydrolysing)
LRGRIDDATRVRLGAEVPVGALLSGGIDSSAVVAAMARNTSQPVKTFAVGFDDVGYDETRFARLVAKRYATDHHELRLRPDALAIMPLMARHYGEPFGDSSAIPSFHVAQLVAQAARVVFTGDGGDESFGGYNHHLPPTGLARLGRLPAAFRRRLPPVLRLLGEPTGSPWPLARLQHLAQRAALDPCERYVSWMSVFDAPARDALLDPDFSRSSGGPSAEAILTDVWKSLVADQGADRMMGVDVETYLPGDLLVKMDIATMASSVEARSPFLDHELMEFAASLPPELKVARSRGKVLLRSALRDDLPEEILSRPKMGFGAPIGRWLREDLSDLAGQLLLDSGTQTLGYLRRGEVERLIADHARKAADHSARLWVLMMLEMWHQEVLGAAPC